MPIAQILRVFAPFLLVTLIAISGCATGRDDAAMTPGGADSGAPADSGIGGLWGGALDSTVVPPAGGTLLVNLYYDDAMLFLDAASGRPITRALVGYDPFDIALSPDQRDAYVSNTRGEASDLGSISIVSIAGRHEGARLDPHPYGRIAGLVASRDRVYLYAAATFGSSILQFNLVSRRLERAFKMPGAPFMLALDLTQNTLFATDRNSALLYALDLTSGNVRQMVVGRNPEAVVLAPDGFSLWVACRGSNSVAVVDPGTLSVRQTLIAGREPTRIAFTPDGAKALVVNTGESSISMFDARGMIRLASIPVLTSPIAVAASGDGRHAWVASDRDDRLSVIDLEQNIEVGRIPLGQPAIHLAWVAP